MRTILFSAVFCLFMPMFAQKAIIVDITKSSWTDTGVDITATQVISIFSYGCASTSGLPSPQQIERWGTPDGSVFGGSAVAPNDHLVPGVRKECLVGKIGSTDTGFVVGSMYSKAAGKSGRLYLGFNDQLTGYSDNFGYFVSFVITPSTILSTASSSDPQILRSYSLEQNYPNPFNPSTTIQYQLAQSSNIEVKIYDNLGKLVRTLQCGRQASGTHSIVWDGKDESGVLASTGTYFYQVGDGQSLLAKKMLLIK